MDRAVLHDPSERAKARRRCFGYGSKIETATLPDGRQTTEFQNWRYCWATDYPKMKRTKVIPGITRESIEADPRGLYVYGCMRALETERRIFDAAYYSIEYHLPGAPFEVRVELDNVAQLARAYGQLAALRKKTQQRLILKIIARSADPEAPLFDERPPRVVEGELKTRAAMSRYMVDLYFKDDLTLAKFDEFMQMHTSEFRENVLAYIPSHEQSDHSYLAKKRALRRRAPEERYLDGEIGLQAYADLRYPHLKAKRLNAMAVHPVPEPFETCVICKRAHVAQIKCLECANRACRDCIQEKFLKHLDERAFILLHHIYCLKLGEPLRAKQSSTPTKIMAAP